MNGTVLSYVPIRPWSKVACLLSALVLVGFSQRTAWAELLYATDGTTVTRFDSDTLGTTTTTAPITGMQGGETLFGIDERPATGLLYGVGSTSRIYLINPITGTATQIGSGPFSPTLTGTAFGTDFNPVPDRIRQVSNTEQNLRLNPNTGQVAGNDMPLNPPGNIVAVAYDRNDSDTSTLTTLYGIDSAAGTLVRIGGVDGTPSPNNGDVTTIGSLNLGTNLNEAIGFDIAPSGIAYASITTGGISRLYLINLTTGAATLASSNGGAIGAGGTPFRGLTADIPVPAFVVLNTNDAGPNSLREAIIASNSMPGVQTIFFAIPGSGVHTINVLSALPAITDAVIIDGTTQPGYDMATGLPLIELNGTSAGNVDGLAIEAGNSTIRAMAINRFGDDGIEIRTNGGNLIIGCFIGTNPGGTAAVGNTDAGVVINDTAGNVIGGTSTDRRNLISGNIRGIEISGANATGNQVLGNYIGTDINGTADLGNNSGVFIAAPDNTVGGTTTGERNVISGNSVNVAISGSAATGNQVQGNFIGTDAAGTAAVGSNTGVRIENASDNVIGGTTAGARNLISGNGFAGVNISVNIMGGVTTGNQVVGNYIGTDVTGAADIPGQGFGVSIFNASDNVIGGTTAGSRNIISGNLQGIGIDISTGFTATGNRVEGNFIGTDAAGTGAVPNTNYAVRIDGGSNNVIGGTAAGAGNIISGNNTNSVAVNLFGADTTNNRVEGNFIGLDVNGAVLPNTYGVDITNGATNNILGGTTPGARNIISGNTNYGVLLQTAGTTGNLVQGNYIGTNAAGTAAIPNAEGIRIEGATGNFIGGTAAGTGNVISGNTTYGVFVRSGGNTIQGNFIGLNAAGNAIVGNGDHGIFVEGVSGTVIGGTTAGARNVISGSGDYGIRLQSAGATNTVIQGNFIGTDVTGTADLGNTLSGVFINDAPNNTIGGTAAGARNLISGNGSAGVAIAGAGATGNVVQGNFIGTDINGTADLGNSVDGVNIASSNNTVGGAAAGAGNVISGNNSAGVVITGGISNTLVQGNYIGTDVNGTAVLGNSAAGVYIAGSNNTNNTVGGTTAAARNVISGNSTGVLIGGGLNTEGNLVQGNYIGTDVNGTADLGNLTGVSILSDSNTVGGTTAGARNVISGNGTGVEIASNSNTVQGNFIGTNAAGTGPLGNTDSGIALITDADNNTIGGTAAGVGNLIAFNNIGVGVTGTSLGNDFLSNSIHSNILLGIDLGNDSVTPNDAGDADTGPNSLQNFPVITVAKSSGGFTTLDGSLNSTASTQFMLQFFANDMPDGSGNGEGQILVGQANVMTDATGNATFSASFPGTVFGNQTVTGTATGPGGTSEFSPNRMVDGPPQPTPTPTPAATPTPSPGATPTPTPTPSPGGTATPTPTPGGSPTPTATPTPAGVAQPLNISTRLRVQTGERVLIGGFIITGNVPKKIIVRGMGPALANSGIADVLLDPVIELYGSDGTLLAENDNWKQDPNQAEIAASGFAPQNDSEAALTATLPPEGYTVILRGQSETTGVGLIEIYDVEPAATSALANISTRGFVENGDHVMIGGFILGSGGGATRIAIRGLGPSLVDDGVEDVLEDPILELYDGNGTKLVSNDDWMDNFAHAIQLTINGLALPHNDESGIFTTLPPGAFTAILSGKNGGTGVGLIEIYNLD